MLLCWRCLLFNRRATWAAADVLYWFFYLPFTVLVVLALVIIPARVLDTAVRPVDLDAVVFEQRVKMKLTDFDPVLGSRFGVLRDFSSDELLFVPSVKKFGYLLKVGDVKKFGDSTNQKLFYSLHVGFAGRKYSIFNRTFYFDDGKTVDLSQVYPSKYGKFT